MKRCPRTPCSSHPKNGRVVRKGYYFRKSDGKYIARFLCLSCHRTFSCASNSLQFGQNKRHINSHLKLLLCSGVSQRRSAKLLHINRKTVSLKLKFLGLEARFLNQKFMKNHIFNDILFDEMETFEHTKCKPLSIPLIVSSEGRKILGFDVASMPATGHLAKIARKKYDYRPDHRKQCLSELLDKVKPHVALGAKISSDEKPLYPPLIRKHYPKSLHKRYKGRRGCIVGQGELKKIGCDPLFSLNHTAAMLRANINRLFRKTWCTSKLPSALYDHISIYVDYHNRVLTEAC